MKLNLKKKIHIFTKAVASVTAFVFLFTSVAPAQLISQPALPPFISPIGVQIPQELGTIQESFSASEKSPSIFLIQDAHDSLDAQENIRFILKHLVEKEKVSAVCFEGGSQELNRPFYNFSRDIQTNRKIWDALFHDGEIGGVERYALEAPAQTKFFGVEDAKTYFQNIHSIQKAFEVNDKAQSGIQNKNAEFSARAGKLLSGKVKKFRDLKKAFEEKRINLERYAKELSKWMPEIVDPANQRQWPQLVRLMKLSEISSKLDVQKIKIPEKLKRLSDSAFTKGHLRWHIERLVDEGFDLEQAPQLKDWIGFQILRDELSAAQLFEEVERLEKQILIRMKISDETRKFLAEEHNWQLTKKLISLQMTRKEWEEVDKLSSAGLTQAARHNYKIVEARDKILADKILNRIRDLKSKKTVLVLGGFHTDKITAFLKANNVAYTIINPAIKNPDRKLNYRARISPPDQTAPVVVGASLGIPEAQPFIQHIVAKASSLGAEHSAWWAKRRENLNEVIEQVKNKSEKARGKDGFSRFVVITTNVDEAFGLLALGRAYRAVIIHKNANVSTVLLPLLGKLLSRYESRAEFVAVLSGKRLDPYLVGKLRDREVKKYTDKSGKEKTHPIPVFQIISFENIEDELQRVPSMPKIEFEQMQTRLARELAGALTERDDFAVSPETVEREVSNFFEQIFISDFSSQSWLASDKNYAAVRDAWRNGNIHAVTGDIWSGALNLSMREMRETPGETLLFLGVSGAVPPGWSLQKWQRFQKENFSGQNSAYVFSDSVSALSEYFRIVVSGQSLGNEVASREAVHQQVHLDPEVKPILKRTNWKSEFIALLKPWAVSGVFASNEWFESMNRVPVVERKSPTDMEIFRGILDEWFGARASSLGEDNERINQTAEKLAHLPIFYVADFNPNKKDGGRLDRKNAKQPGYMPLSSPARLQVARQLKEGEEPLGIFQDFDAWKRRLNFIGKYYALFMTDGSLMFFHLVKKSGGFDEIVAGDIVVTGPGTAQNATDAANLSDRAETLRQAFFVNEPDENLVAVVEASSLIAKLRAKETKRIPRNKLRETGKIKKLDGASLGTARKILDDYRSGSKRIQLEQITFGRGGNARGNFALFMREVFDAFLPVHFQRPQGLPSRELIDRNKIPAVPSHLTSGMKETPQVFGRTLVYPQNNGKALYVKLLKTNEDPARLAYEHDMMNFLREKKFDWGLKGDYPQGKLRIGKIPVDALPSEIVNNIGRGSKLFGINREDGYFTVMIYEVLDEGYSIYLNDHGITPEQFERAYGVNVHDRFVLARHGLFDTEIIELFHNEDHERGYDWMVDVAKKEDVTRWGAGRLNDVIGATLYPNIRLSGLADFAELQFVDDIFAEAKELGLRDGRLQRLIDFYGENADVIQNVFTASLLGDTLLALALIPMTYWDRREELQYSTESSSSGTFLQKMLQELFEKSFESYTGYKWKNEPGLSIDVRLIARQMAYFMVRGYEEEIKNGKIPGSLFPDIKTQFQTLFDDFGNEMGSVSSFTLYSIGSRFAAATSRSSHDLGSWNGAMPVQELIRALYISTALMMAGLHEREFEKAVRLAQVWTADGMSLGRKAQIGSTTLQIQLHVASEIEILERKGWKDYEISFEKAPTPNSIIPGRPEEYWIHLHLRKKGLNTPPGNGMLFKMRIENGQIILTTPMAEMDMDSGNANLPLGLVPLKKLVSESAVQWLIDNAARAVQKRQSRIIQIIEEHKKGNLPLKYVLARAVTPRLRGTWDMLKAEQFGKRRRAVDGGIAFERLDMPSTAASLGRTREDYFIVVDGKKINLFDAMKDGTMRASWIGKFMPEPLEVVELPDKPEVYSIQEAIKISAHHKQRRYSENALRSFAALRKNNSIKGISRHDLEWYLNSRLLEETSELLGFARNSGGVLGTIALQNGAVRVGRNQILVPISFISVERIAKHHLVSVSLLAEEIGISEHTFVEYLKNPNKHFSKSTMHGVFGGKSKLLEKSLTGGYRNIDGKQLAVDIFTAWQIIRLYLDSVRKDSEETIGSLADKVGVDRSVIFQAVQMGEITTRRPSAFFPHGDIPHYISSEEAGRVLQLFNRAVGIYQVQIERYSKENIKTWKDLMGIIREWDTTDTLRDKWGFKSIQAINQWVERGGIRGVHVVNPINSTGKWYFPPQEVRPLEARDKQRFQEIAQFVKEHTGKEIKTREDLLSVIGNWTRVSDLAAQSGISRRALMLNIEKGLPQAIKIDILSMSQFGYVVPPQEAQRWIEHYKQKQEKAKKTAAPVVGSSLGTPDPVLRQFNLHWNTGDIAFEIELFEDALMEYAKAIKLIEQIRGFTDLQKSEYYEQAAYVRFLLVERAIADEDLSVDREEVVEALKMSLEDYQRAQRLNRKNLDATWKIIDIRERIGRITGRGFSLGSLYGVSERSIRLVGSATKRIYGEDLRQVDPKLYERMLSQEFSSKLPSVQFPEFIRTKEPALVITGPVSPEAILAQISSGKTVVVHYSDPAYKKRFDTQFARAVELGVLTQDQLKKHAHFADLSFAGLSESQFYEKLLKGDRIGNLRSLNWIKQQAGLASSDPVVWMAKNSVIDFVSKKDIPGIGLPFVDQYLVDASVKDKILYDIERLALAVKLSRGFEELKSQGLVIFQNGRYSQTDRFLQSFLGNAVLEQQVTKLLATMA